MRRDIRKLLARAMIAGLLAMVLFGRASADNEWLFDKKLIDLSPRTTALAGFAVQMGTFESAFATAPDGALALIAEQFEDGSLGLLRVEKLAENGDAVGVWVYADGSSEPGDSPGEYWTDWIIVHPPLDSGPIFGAVLWRGAILDPKADSPAAQRLKKRFKQLKIQAE